MCNNNPRCAEPAQGGGGDDDEQRRQYEAQPSEDEQRRQYEALLAAAGSAPVAEEEVRTAQAPTQLGEDEQRQQFEMLLAAASRDDEPTSDETKRGLEALLMGKRFVEDPAEGFVPSIATEFTVAHLPPLHRIFRSKNSVMTMDYRPDRINIWLDKEGRCAEITWV
ncbi:hypothetical protein H4R18_005213 [Coemansia javaensis]|uniref:Uncharacterized protein n=1 Tax=Coemansia javaensis TaxID=2761396 RepID=A0A9W8H278_9FUNG|nr:hypothetical protein H4R18_005213 [Coemansia javaensis]